MKHESLRIVVTGLAGTYPFGGMFWDYLQYALGLHRLGHDVLYVEDTGRWCYHPRRQTFVRDGQENADHLGKQIARLDPALSKRWCFRDAAGQCFGKDWGEVRTFCRTADLFLHLSASPGCWMHADYRAAARIAFLDSDPLYTQAQLIEPDEKTQHHLDLLRDADCLLTFGLNIGHADCRVPTLGYTWHTTRQPTVLDCFEPLPAGDRRAVLTTVASWEPTETGPTIAGMTYTGKSTEFLRMIDLPGRSALPLEVALSGEAPRDRLRAHGWQVVDGLSVSDDPWRYRGYLARSFAECSVAKNAYVAGRTGWFSTRTACYLALGVPAIVQDTGFGHALPTGEGLLTFTNVDEAAEAIDRVHADPTRHSRAAREIAEQYFDSDRVLGELLDIVMRSPQGSVV